MISIVSPFYNEQAVIHLFFQKIEAILIDVTESYEIICINDGSSDNTLALLLKERERNPNIKIIDFSRNFGKEAALSAGLDYAKGDAVIPIDVDLQDPPELIPLMIAKWKEGNEIVLAKRIDRSSDTLSKRITAKLFYKLHNMISDRPIPENVGDYRLMDRVAVDALKKLPERQRFMKGLFSWVGFKTTEIEYVRAERAAGNTKFNGWKLWNLAMEGITSFSTVPLRAWSYLGLLFAVSAFFYGLFIITRIFMYGIDVPGYASLLTTILFLGGVQLMGLGMLGEYIGRIYLESKSRPLYLVRKEYT
jgi:polyisoprenyl-phosphate glycosyltransferase